MRCSMCCGVIICISALIGSCGGGRRPGTGGITPFKGKLSSLSEDAGFLGPGWVGPTGLVVDDLGSLSALSPEERKAAQQFPLSCREKPT